MKPTDVRVADAAFEYADYQYRTPIKFGGVALDKATVLTARVTLEDRSGRRAVGVGSMPLSNVWSFPSRVLDYDQTLGAMKALVTAFRDTTAALTDYGHPIELGHELEPRFLAHLAPIGARLGLPEPIPALAGLVAASPFDAAVHDGFGKLLGLSSYRTYGPEFLTTDLGQYLGPDFSG
ncbi:MAG TPA: hypothetical protein VH092_12755, partial [Urbifossiella sp.]|nr:hypothetical protein [Urbifossiella sp.]